jgi:type II secretory pathway component GspD/PulD (secretin)
MRRFARIYKAALILLIGITTAWAQPGSRNEPITVQTFYLKNATQQNVENEILTALRNILPPMTKTILVPSQNAIIVGGGPDQIEFAQKLINDLDKPLRAYRITYTLIDLDGSRRIGEQHYTMVTVPGQRAQMKQGNRVPIMEHDEKSNSGAAAVMYIDLGLNFEATLDQVEDGLSLKTKVERSSAAEERSSAVPQDPIIRQSVVEGSSVITPGKPLIIGSFDILDTTRHLDVQVSVEPLSPEAARKAGKP